MGVISRRGSAAGEKEKKRKNLSLIDLDLEKKKLQKKNQVCLPDNPGGAGPGTGLLGPLVSAPAPSQKAAKVGAATRMLAALKAAMVLN